MLPSLARGGRLLRDFDREILVFWISGRLREVVGHGDSTVLSKGPSK